MAKPLRCDRPADADHAQLYELLVSELTEYVVFLVDPTGCITSWNPAVERILGYREAEWVGQPAHIIFTPEDQAVGAPEEEMTKAARDGRAPDNRWHQRKDGSRLFVEGTMVALKDSTGRLLGFSKVMHDMTERERTEDALRVSEARLGVALEAGELGVWELDLKTHDAWRSQQHDQIFGYQTLLPEWSYEMFLEHVVPEDRADVDRRFQDALKAQAPWTFECRIKRVDGAVRWIWVQGKVDTQGQARRMKGMVRDITAQKAAEAERERLVLELARSNEDLSQFARVASHDLKSPLHTITQFSQLVLKRYEGKVLDEGARDFLGLVIENAKRMGVLISDLLRYAEAPSAAAVPVGAVSAGSMVDAALAHLRGEIQESGAVVTYDSLPEARCDGTQLVQLFQNLIGNAIKYRKPTETPRIHISARPDGAFELFSVQDNGIGLECGHTARIFEPFKRLHGTEIPGSGIGLAVCKKIVERAGGRIWVESELGQGSTFYFTLPR